MKKYLNLLFVSSIFYTIIRFILKIISFNNLEIEQYFYYHHSDRYSWYIFFIIFPLVLSISITAKLVNKNYLLKIGKLYFPLLLILTLTGIIINNNYWGYFFKRQAIFEELNKTEEILSITSFEKKINDKTYRINSDSTKFENVERISDTYYANNERPIRAIVTNGKSHGNIDQWKNILKSKKAKLNQTELNSIFSLIEKSKFLDVPKSSYEIYGNQYNGSVIEFVTINKNNSSFSIHTILNETRKPTIKYFRKYLFVTLKSGEIENDHYPVYEFLILKNKIIKKQKYYYDIAGIEGMEYSNFSAILEFTLLLIISILYSFVNIIMRKIKK